MRTCCSNATWTCCCDGSRSVSVVKFVQLLPWLLLLCLLKGMWHICLLRRVWYVFYMLCYLQHWKNYQATCRPNTCRKTIVGWNYLPSWGVSLHTYLAPYCFQNKFIFSLSFMFHDSYESVNFSREAFKLIFDLISYLAPYCFQNKFIFSLSFVFHDSYESVNFSREAFKLIFDLICVWLSTVYFCMAFRCI